MAFIAEVNTTLTKSKIAPMNSVTKDPVAVENVGVILIQVKLISVVLQHNPEFLHQLSYHESRFRLGNHLQRRSLPPRAQLWRQREAKRKLEYLETEGLHIQTMTEQLKLLLQQLFGLCVGEALLGCPWRKRMREI
uniref:Uncharacterized protein n=1 Tax=Cucumis melo TaxID=3656 RepID=A0A9I9EM21_CUCME